MPCSRTVLQFVIVALVAAAMAGCVPPRRVPQPNPSSPARYLEARVFIPLADVGGHAFAESRFRWLEDQFAQRFGRWVNLGDFDTGSSDGRGSVRERTRRYLITIKDDDVEPFLSFLRQVKKEFHGRHLNVSFVEGVVMSI